MSALLLSRVVVDEPRRALTWSQIVADGLDGLRFIRDSATLWSNTLFSLAAQFANPVINSLSPVLIVRRFADNDPTAGAVQFGAAEASLAFGAVLASAVLPRYLSRYRKGRLLIVGFGVVGGTIVLIALAPTFAMALVLYMLLGIANVIFYVPTVTILQEATPPTVRARVFGARIALTNLSWLPVVLVSGALADLVPVELLIGLAGLVTLATAIVGAFLPAIRDVP